MDYKAALLELYFNLERKKDWREYVPSMQKYSSVLHSLKTDIQKASSTDSLQKLIEYMILLYKLVAYTRDSYYGKGEQDLTYMMIYIWYQYFPLPALNLLNILPKFLESDDAAVEGGEGGEGVEDGQKLPYGSWKDMSRFCKFVRFFSKQRDQDPLIEYAVGLLNHQLDLDNRAWSEALSVYNTARNNPMRIVEPVRPNVREITSLVCKWIPRESSSSMRWLFDRCVIQWVRSITPEYFKTVRDEKHFGSALRKAKREYRLMVSGLSKEWDIPQIKQCARSWKTIDPVSVSGKTLHHNRRAFLNIDSQGCTRKKTMKDDDRIVCSEKFMDFFAKDFCGSGGRDGREGREERGGRQYNLNMDLYIRSVFYKSVNLSEHCFLQKSWDKICLSLEGCKHYFLPVLDLSLFSSDGFYSAVGFSLLLSQISSMGKRMIGFDKTPVWLDLDGYKNNIVDQVDYLKQIGSEKHIGSNLVESIDLVANALLQSDTSIDEMSQLVLVLISDFNDIKSFEATHEKIANVFEKKEVFTHKMPKIVYWNVCRGDGGGGGGGGRGGRGDGGGGIIQSSTHKLENGFLVHGGSLSVLRFLCSCSSFNDFTEWNLFTHLLSHSRYNVLENYIHELLNAA